MSADVMTRKKQDAERNPPGRPRKPDRTYVGVRMDNELLALVDECAVEEERYERSAMINVLVREALAARGKLK